MKNFLILTNEKKDPGLRISKKIQDYIEKQGGISQRMCDFTRHVQKDMNCITKDTECVIVLGGDGTMLHAARLIVELVNKKLPGYYRTPASQIQVLTPMQRGVVGATNLNMALQEALNPQGEGLRRSGFVYRPNDKVMQIKNNYDKEVFNGDIGIIESVDLQDRTLLVNFDGRSIEYDATELDELVHAYATTIHKAQGSEYPIVVMPVLMNHFVMLQRNLIYTGITRAKRILVMVGTKKALAYAVRNVTVTRRNTLLKERLAGQIQVKKPAKIYYPDFSGTAEDTRMVAENRSDYGN